MEKEFNYIVDQFADLQILRYKVPEFDKLSLKQKLLLYHLSEAALMGRDILFDQTVDIIYVYVVHWKLFICIMTVTGVVRNFRLLKFI